MAKKIWQSKLVWKEVVMGIVAVITAIQTVDPSVAQISWVVTASSVLGVILRVFLTDSAIRF